MRTPHLILHDDGSLTVRFSPEHVPVIEAGDRDSQAELFDRIAEQTFVRRCIDLTKPEAVR